MLTHKHITHTYIQHGSDRICVHCGRLESDDIGYVSFRLPLRANSPKGPGYVPFQRRWGGTWPGETGA